MTRQLGPILSLFICILHASTAFAADAVVVVPNGGSTGVTVLDLVETGGVLTVDDLGTRRVVPLAMGPQVLNDVKILPDGSHLVSGGDGFGLRVTDVEGEEILALSRRATFGAVATASVGAYFTGAEPSRIFIGSDTASAAFVRQVSSERLLLFEPTRLGELRAEHAEVVVLPGNGLAVGAHFPDIGISILDILSVTETGTDRIRYTNAENVNHPAATTIDTDFAEIRDLHGFGGDTPRDLLVVTRTRAFRLAEDGTKTWTVDPGTFGLGGEFASGVVLPSGRIALATFQPGRWTDPHPNHRVVWLEADGTYGGALSGALQAAPTSIDALAGHGGTGTTGFTAGLEELPLGDPEDLALAGPVLIDSPTYTLGNLIGVSASIVFDGENAVALRRARLVGAPLGSEPDCTTVDVPIVDFAVDESVTILSGESYPLRGERVVDSVFDFGPWCAWVEITDTSGRVERLGEPAAFAVVEQGGDAGGEEIPGSDLGFGQPELDAGVDGSTDAGDLPATDHGGCGCASGGAGGASIPLLILAGMAVVRRRYRAARRRR